MSGAKRLGYAAGGAILLVAAGWLFLGIYVQREFGDRYLFVKHRPTLKFVFRSPRGEADPPKGGLDPALQQEERLFKEFVERGGGQKRSIPIW